MTDRLKIGVAGVGSIGKNHARVLSELPNADLAAIYDVNQEAAQEIAAQYGTRAAATLEELAEAVDAVTVATPTSTHRAVGGQMLEAGKHVLIEKPISDSVEQAKELVDLAHRENRILQVGHIERFNPVMSTLEKLLTNARFIEVSRLSPFPNRSLDIGVVLDVMIHDLEIILHLVKAEIESVDAVGVPVLTQNEDIANARIRFKNGCVANVTSSRVSAKKMRKIRVFQPAGYVSLDYQAQEGKIYRREGMSIVSEDVQVEKDEPLKLELASFVECALQGSQPKVSGREGAAALDLAMEITRQIHASAPNV